MGLPAQLQATDLSCRLIRHRLSARCDDLRHQVASCVIKWPVAPSRLEVVRPGARRREVSVALGEPLPASDEHVPGIPVNLQSQCHSGRMR